MKNVMFLFLSIISSTLFGQAETRQLSNFSDISVSAGIHLTIDHDDKNFAEVSVTGADNNQIITEIKGDRLVIKWASSSNSWGSKKSAKVELHYKNISGISASSGAKVEAIDMVNSETFSAEASSGATIALKVECTDLSVDISSGSRITLNGSAKNQDVDVSSGASYRGSDLETEHTEVDGSSGASAKVHVTKSLKADVSSGASVRYKGNPSDTDFDADKWSGGSVKKM